MTTRIDQVTTWVTACRCLSASDRTSSSESLALASILAMYRFPAQEANRVSRIVPITSSTAGIRLPRTHTLTSFSGVSASIMGKSSASGWSGAGTPVAQGTGSGGQDSTQNSLPSGSAITVRSGPSSRTVAPRAVSLATSTKARSGVDSSSTSVPSAAAQNRATRSASAQSQVTVLIYVAIRAGYAVGRPGRAAILPDWG